MENEYIFQHMAGMATNQLKQVCQRIVAGLGFEDVQDFTLSDVAVAFQASVERRSTDGMFCNKESWLLAFSYADQQLNAKGLPTAVQAAQTIGTQNVMMVVFGTLDEDISMQYHEAAHKAELRSDLLSGPLAQALLQDYAADLLPAAKRGMFSFSELRKRMCQQASEAAWRKQFVSLSALPIHVNEVRHKEDKQGRKASSPSKDVLKETDLPGALRKTPSFLLLGDPGAGKTTCLQELAEELANVGGRTPVFLSLNCYEGNLLQDLGEVLCGTVDQLSEQEVTEMLATGAFTVILDGLNEVQAHNLQPQLVQSINELTRSDSPTARSHWIVSSRRYDYMYASLLSHLDKHCWELLPLAPDLIYKYLTEALGEEEGKQTYFGLGRTIQEVCSNPLLLSMLLSVRQEGATPATNRGMLYHQFINLLLQRGAKLPNNRQELAELASLLERDTLTIDEYCQLARTAMTNLAHAMQEKGTTAISVGEALIAFEQSQALTSPERAAAKLYASLSRRGLLKERAGRVTFFHHTFQEYFNAVMLSEMPLEQLLSGGVKGAHREALVFMASMLDSDDKLNNLIERILKLDIRDEILAYAIMRSASIPIPEALQLKVASSLWHGSQRGGYLGAGQRQAQLLLNLAAQREQSIEELLDQVLQPTSTEQFNTQMLCFYQTIGDLSAQQKLLNKLEETQVSETSEDLLAHKAITERQLGHHKEAIDLYTTLIGRDPNCFMYYSNRALSYNNMGANAQAEEGYKRAIVLNPENSVNRTNYALFLIKNKRKEESIEQLQAAIDCPQQYHRSYLELGNLLGAEDPQQALSYLEKAVALANRPDEQTVCLKELLKLQEQHERFAGALISISQLLHLNPTSPLVSAWKRRSAQLRQQYDAKEQQHHIERGEASLNVLAHNVLHMAGWTIDHTGLQWLRAVSDRQNRPSPLTILLLDVSQLSDTLVQDRIATLLHDVPDTKQLLLFTSTETMQREARISLARVHHAVNFITAVELRSAVMRGEQACYELLTNALHRDSNHSDPFREMKLIQSSSDFFGRERQKNDLTKLILEGKMVGLYGIHKIGKSSLLKQIFKHLSVNACHITSVEIEMTAMIKRSSTLYREILHKLGQELPEPITTEQFQKELSALQKKKQRDDPRHQVLVILDEYPYLLPGKAAKLGMTNFLEVLGLFKLLHQEGWFHFLPCGRTTALSRTACWEEGENPLIGMIHEHFLGPLTRDEMEELMRVQGYKAELEFSSEALECIWLLTGGHPCFTRTLGSHILEIAKSSSSEITPNIVDQAAERYLDKESDLLRKIYRDELEEEEERIVRDLALSQKPLLLRALLPDNPTQDDRERVRAAVENLLATSVLQKDDKRYLSHRYELLRRVIVKDSEDFD